MTVGDCFMVLGVLILVKLIGDAVANEFNALRAVNHKLRELLGEDEDDGPDRAA